MRNDCLTKRDHVPLLTAERLPIVVWKPRSVLSQLAPDLYAGSTVEWVKEGIAQPLTVPSLQILRERLS